MDDENNLTKAELLARIVAGWETFQAYVKTLTEQQLITPTDAAGWTAKDHIAHLVVWEDSINALLNKQSRPGQMGIDPDTWAGRDFDKINAIIQRRERDKPLAEVMQWFEAVHTRLMAKLQTLAEEDLHRPYNYYQPDSTVDRPAVGWIVGDTYAHYAEHQPWIDAIVKGK
jgi:uncharacterized protein (TIGR03083 family)